MIMAKASPSKKAQEPIQKIAKAKRAGSFAQVVKHLHSKNKALGSNPSMAKIRQLTPKRKKERRKEGRKEGKEKERKHFFLHVLTWNLRLCQLITLLSSSNFQVVEQTEDSKFKLG
jgi:hypothetical protein